MNVCECYQSLVDLYNKYNNKTLLPNDEQQFIVNIDNSMVCVEILIKYAKTLNLNKNSQVDKSEKDMLLDILDKYNSKLLFKARLIEKRIQQKIIRIQQKNTKTLLAIDEFKKINYPDEYNASILLDVLPSCPKNKVNISKLGGKKKTSKITKKKITV